MVKVVVAAISLWSLSACAFALPPNASEPLAIGAITGFISDSPDVMMCGMSIMTEGTALAKAARDLKKGITTFNLTEVADSLRELADALDDSKSTSKTCKVVVTDVKTIVRKLKEIHGAKDLLLHIVGNLFEDGEKIFTQLAQAEHAYKSGWDYMTAGQNLGMAFRRMLVGELNGTAPLPPMPKNATMPLLIGIAEGFVSDKPDLMTCGMAAMGEVVEVEHAVKDLKSALLALNVTATEDALRELATAIDDRSGAKKQCHVVASDLKLIAGALKKIHGPKDLVTHIVTNLFEDGEKIFGQLAAAEHAYKTGWDYMTTGQNLGMVFRRLLVGELNSTSVTAAAPAEIVIL